MKVPAMKYANSSEMWFITEATPNSVGDPSRSCRCQNRKVKMMPIPKPMNQAMNKTEMYLGKNI